MDLGLTERGSLGDSAVKEKKRHREHSSSRSHHHRKHKDSGKIVVIEDSDKVSPNLSLSKVDVVVVSMSPLEVSKIRRGEEEENALVAGAIDAKPSGASGSRVLAVCRNYAANPSA
ncbi:hypothetical protein AgCh_031662 [Apium graveolens]